MEAGSAVGVAGAEAGPGPGLGPAPGTGGGDLQASKYILYFKFFQSYDSQNVSKL